MRLLGLTFLGLLGLTGFCFSQSPPAETELTITPGNGFNIMSWDSVIGEQYLIEYSSDLQTWDYLPQVFMGNGNPINYWIQSNSDKIFFQITGTTLDLFSQDSDGDGYSDALEIQYGTDPDTFTNGPANPGGGNSPVYPEYPIEDPNIANLVKYIINIDSVGTAATGASPPVRTQYGLLESFDILTVNGEVTNMWPSGIVEHENWPIKIPVGDVSVTAKMIATETKPYDRKLPLLKEEETSISGTSYQELELKILANQNDSNVVQFGSLIDTIADREISAVVPIVQQSYTPRDDFVAVSLGVDEDLATEFCVRVIGKSGLTAHLKMKNGDGQVKFKDDSIPTQLFLNSTEPNWTQLWGEITSSGRDTTIIEFDLKENGITVGTFEKNITVFKGVNIGFDGDFVANVNSIIEQWRPNPSVPTQANAAAEDVQAYASLLQFQDGDQSQPRRTWTPAPNVTVKSGETVTPHIVLDPNLGDTDELLLAEISVDSGFLRPGVGNSGGGPGDDVRSDEVIESFKIRFRKPGVDMVYGTASIPTGEETAHKVHPSGDLGFQTGWDFSSAISAKIGADTAGSSIKNYYIGKSSTLAEILKVRQQWKNESLVFQKEAYTKRSFLIKGMLGAQEKKAVPASTIRCDLQRYNIWYLKGTIADGILTSETLP